MVTLEMVADIHETLAVRFLNERRARDRARYESSRQAKPGRTR